MNIEQIREIAQQTLKLKPESLAIEGFDEFARRLLAAASAAPGMTDLMVPPETIGDLPDTTPNAAPEAADTRDARRYRWLRDSNDRIDYTSDFKATTAKGRMLEAITTDVPECFKITLLFHHVPKGGEPIWKDGGHIDWAANMDAAIDAAIAQQGEES